MNRRTPNSDRDAALLAGDVASPSRSAWAETAVILPFRKAMPAAFAGFAGEEADDDCWESLGLHAVRIVGNFKRPSIHCEVQAPGWEEEETEGLR